MLFISQVQQLFEKMEMGLYSTATQTRKTETAKRLNFFHDGQLERLEEQLNELFSEPESMIKVTLNIVKKIINNLAQTYREAPVRTLPLFKACKSWILILIWKPMRARLKN